MPVPRPSTRPTTLWALTGVIGLAMVIDGFVSLIGILLILAQVAFALLHGARRYGRRPVWVFVAAGLVISNILENLSIETGFPFGHYHYTDGSKLFLVPWFIGPAYLATGYLAWIVGTVLLGDVRRNSPWLTTIGTPVIGAFAMTAWDLSLDPTSSTIQHTWIWENGGGFFGVPLGNFLGWTFTVYLFMQVFALYLRHRGPLPPAEPARTTTSDLQAVLLYGLTTVSYLTPLFTGNHKLVTDAAGHTWQTADIYESSALVTVYGMLFITLLALLRIAQQHTAALALTPVAAPAEHPQPEPLHPSA